MRLAEVVGVLSLGTDLGMGLELESVLRSCLTAVRFGEAVGLDEAELADVYYLGLLRLIGCTADAHLTAAAFGDEMEAKSWMQTLDPGRPAQVIATIFRHHGEGRPPWQRAQLLLAAMTHLPGMMESPLSHCEVAERLSQRLGLPPHIPKTLGWAFERWDGKGPRRVKGEDLPVALRVVAVTQEALIFYRLGGVEAAVAVAKERSGGAYDPRLVERFCQEAPRLLPRADEGAPWEDALAAEPGPRPRLSEAQVDDAVRAMADFVDLKSPHTLAHSSGVADLAAAAAQRAGLPDVDVTALRRAAWLHDLGRVAITAAIWAKPGPLTAGEWEKVRLHPYHTGRVLNRSGAFARIGALAGLHHERLDGSGYHRGAGGGSLPMQARLLAAADAYHAMTEPRAHRPARSADEAAGALRDDARAGKMDGDAVAAVLSAAGHRARAVRRMWPAGLTDREVEVLRLAARGLSKKEVAARLVLSERTVHHHVEHVYEKLGVSTRAAAALFAMQHNLLED